MFLIDPNTVIAGAFVFLRIGGILFALPVLGDKTYPVQARTLMTLALTLCIYPMVPEAWFPDHQWDVLIIAGTVIKEISIGLFIGFVADTRRRLSNGWFYSLSSPSRHPAFPSFKPPLHVSIGIAAIFQHYSFRLG